MNYILGTERSIFNELSSPDNLARFITYILQMMIFKTLVILSTLGR
jgi:hypothetical protein